MDKMKSALERALERADRMGKLSPEEMHRQNVARYVPAGEAIAQRFLGHGQISILSEQLEKLENQGRSIAKDSAIAILISSIDLEDRDLTQRALEGIIGLKGSQETEKIADKVMALFGSYAWQKKMWHEDHAEDAGKKTKHQMFTAGISGGAVAGINIESDDEWIKKTDELRSEFNQHLIRMKVSLAQLVTN